MALDAINKAYSYLKRNGVEDTVYASLERVIGREKYTYVPISDDVRHSEMSRVWKRRTLFSIVVPAFETDEVYMRDLVNSVMMQTYPNWELIVADASKTDKVKNVLASYKDQRIRYLRLSENKGISANTNAGIVKAIGEYIGLLDHDDILTTDALYEFASLIEEGVAENIEYAFIYSDEDKCNGDGDKFFEPNIKPEFNLDLLLTNNYVCHFLMMKSNLMKSLLLRDKFDGAQDHDLVLRAYAATYNKASRKTICYGHIPRVLYHWRCHSASTASNPNSKRYAYDAGRRAVKDYLFNAGIHATVKKTKHNGFFRVIYKDYLEYLEGSTHEIRKKQLCATMRGSIAYRMFLNRYDVGAIGGPLIEKHKITGGIIDTTKTCPYDGLNTHFSGYMHRATLQQSAFAVDIRNMMVNEGLSRCIFKVSDDQEHMHLFNRDIINSLKELIAEERLNSPYIDVTALLADVSYDDFDYVNASIALCNEIKLEGYINYYDPKFVIEEE